MKTYIITEKDIEILKYGSRHSIDDILDNLNELSVPKKIDLNFQIPEDFYTNRPKYFLKLELNNQQTEFFKFIEENNFTKPEQPYYEKDGEIFDYGDLRELFLKSRE